MLRLPHQQPCKPQVSQLQTLEARRSQGQQPAAAAAAARNSEVATSWVDETHATRNRRGHQGDDLGGHPSDQPLVLSYASSSSSSSNSCGSSSNSRGREINYPQPPSAVDSLGQLKQKGKQQQQQHKQQSGLQQPHEGRQNRPGRNPRDSGSSSSSSSTCDAREETADMRLHPHVSHPLSVVYLRACEAPELTEAVEAKLRHFTGLHRMQVCSF